jgi:hypothetical protein
MYRFFHETASPTTLMEAIMPIMRTRLIVTALCVALPACAWSPSSQSPQLPPGVFGTYEDNDVGAINQAAWAFAERGRTHGNPIEAARAVIAVDYLADELSANPRWVELSGISKMGMVRARADVRRALGIAPDAPSQLVIDALPRFTAAMRDGDQAAATRALAGPVFTLPPAQTQRILSDLPYIASANQATLQASSEILRGGFR